MAVFNLAITYPDAEQPRILTALKAQYGVTTNAEAIEGFRREVLQRLKYIVLHVERRQALATVNETNPT